MLAHVHDLTSARMSFARSFHLLFGDGPQLPVAEAAG
jgi:hypothetical protein